METSVPGATTARRRRPVWVALILALVGALLVGVVAWVGLRDRSPSGSASPSVSVQVSSASSIVATTTVPQPSTPAPSGTSPSAPASPLATTTGTGTSPASPVSVRMGEQLGLSIPGNLLSYASQAVLDRDLDRVKASGMRWIRFDIVANAINLQPGRYDWPVVDRVVRGADRRGLKILAILTTLPTWCVPAGAWKTGPVTQAHRDAYVTFARAVAQRYRGIIDAYEIWNEPNLDQFWAPTPSTRDYTALLRAVYPVLKQAAPGTPVLSGGLGDGESPDIHPVPFLQGMYDRGGKGFFDAVALHPYADRNPAVTPGTGWGMNEIAPLRALMDARGDQQKRLWATETGAPTGGVGSVSPQRQAQMAQGVVKRWFASPRVGPLFWYTLNDYSGDAKDPENFFGLFTLNGTSKPAWWVLRAAAREPAR